MRVRPFHPADAAALAAIFHASVHEIGGRDYTAAQVAAWSPAPPEPELYFRRAKGRIVLVAENADAEPIGYTDMWPDGTIDHLYVRPDAVGLGVGSALIAALERTARERGISLLVVEASEGAQPLFVRRGFHVEARQDFAVRGVAIHNYRMAKPLNGESADAPTSPL